MPDPIDPHEADLGQAYQDIKDKGRGLYDKFSPKAREYFDKFLEHTRPAGQWAGKMMDSAKDYMANEQSPDAFKEYVQAVSVMQKLPKFADISAKMIQDAFQKQKQLQDLFEKAKAAEKQVAPFIRPGVMKMNDVSSQYIDYLNELTQDMMKISDDIKQIAAQAQQELSQIDLGSQGGPGIGQIKPMNFK